ncbi:MAG: tRNA preQ1(34) S-adenosylmethionine ribosyltransferase-isomerase QueA [Verrucomicrobia bacterium]|nr:tRNA preQ1(34) S-adenosylmethionine ribosyltransferase-isomerase QueA [Verrucomicrobiota bacterium]
MKTADFDYALPSELIAQQPLPDRDAARMLVLDRASGAIHHQQFTAFPQHLRPGEILVLNDTKVIPARLIGHKPTGGEVELLLVEELSAFRWLALARPAKRLREGTEIILAENPKSKIQSRVRETCEANPKSELLLATVESKREAGEVIVRFTGTDDLFAALQRVGHVPLPPYIRHGEDAPADRERYQTIFARQPCAVAAPTAGLHFTPRTFEALAQRGVLVHRLTLHVGPGTFKPVATDDIEQHAMHIERFDIPPDTAAAVNAAKRDGRRVVCVGTTTVRALESVADTEGLIRAGSGETDIFIYPSYEFRVADALLTNFHLPRSTLLMLVSAFAGREPVLRAYEEAVRERYRFYSYGDCMLVT